MSTASTESAKPNKESEHDQIPAEVSNIPIAECLPRLFQIASINADMSVPRSPTAARVSTPLPVGGGILVLQRS
jgi:hypothetical protein